ncbi:MULTISPECIES: hypothetical protein [Micromonospora]|uniref:hypothetical protein n=1 Tax=Micromonospora TaxID=1873 RepID=UPI0011B4BF7A|nr:MULTISPECIES: hypothetical protein [unclassified Micromonospora]MBM0227502.1 hypothetical protein [Micromonospora sp. ATA51]
MGVSIPQSFHGNDWIRNRRDCLDQVRHLDRRLFRFIQALCAEPRQALSHHVLGFVQTRLRIKAAVRAQQHEGMYQPPLAKLLVDPIAHLRGQRRPPRILSLHDPSLTHQSSEGVEPDVSPMSRD